MTLKELAMRIKKLREEDPVEMVREVLDVAGEFTLYRPTSKWKEILSDLGMKELEDRVACATFYGTDGSIFGKVKASLKKRYKAVLDATVDELGYRCLFVCGESPQSEPQLLLLVNYYEASRAETKSMYNSNTAADTDAADTADDSVDTDDDADVEIDLFE